MAPLTTAKIMAAVLLALLPGTAVSAYFYGTGHLSNMIVAVAMGVVVEIVCLLARHRSIVQGIRDGSTLVTCVLIALALPPHTPWPAMAVAVTCAIALAKHLYGGLGNNLFNPAIVGYAVVLVSFPTVVAEWPVPLDGTTSATALVSLKYRGATTVAEAWQAGAGFGSIGGYAWEWMNGAFLLGGIALMAARLVAWRVPVAFLTTLAVLAAAFYDSGSSASHGSPVFHWFTGATMLTAFFFATDPVTHPATSRGQVVFGVVAGTVTFAVRAWGNYPDGAAFAILLANAITPYLDRRLVVAEARADG